MKWVKALLFFLSIGLSLSGQVAERMSFQAVIRNSSNQLVVSQKIGLRISILQGSSTGPVAYQEIFDPEPVTNINGLVTVEIGGGIPVMGSFSGIDWAEGPYFIQIETDPTGGENYSITGTSQILSVPYSLYAREAGNGFSGDYNDLINTPTYAPVASSGSYSDLSDQPVLFDGDYNSLTNKPELFNGAWTSLTGKPTTLQGYGITDAVNLSGSQTITGNKTFSGIINASNHNITNIAEPVNSTDAANKSYVDALKNQLKELEQYVKNQLPIPSKGLVAYYPFNGNANDESGNGHHGTVKGAVLTQDRFGTANKAYKFTASNGNHITVNNDIGNFGVADFTISVWVKRSTDAGNEIFTQRSALYRNSSWWELGWGFFRINENATYESTANINKDDTLRNNVWYHFAAIREEAALKFYLNGVLLDEKSSEHILSISNPAQAEIGCHFFENPLDCFDGDIDDIRLYNKALSLLEIQMLYNEGDYAEIATGNNNNGQPDTEAWQGKVMTVHGLIPADSMGITLPHEHLLIVHKGNYLDLTSETKAISELGRFASYGGKTLVEASNIGIARNPEGLKRISTATGINVVMGSGFYKDKWIHDTIKIKTVEQLSSIITNDIRKGINGIHAGLIGEVGVSRPITAFEEKSLLAAGRSQQATGAAVNIHFDVWATPGEINHALDLLESEGADLSRVYISHRTPYVELANEYAAYIQRGCYISFDLLGMEIYPPVALNWNKELKIAETIKALIDMGYLNNILISQDLCFSVLYVENGGYGYAHILKGIVPKLKAGGITDEQIRTIIVENPKRILAFHKQQ